MHQELHVTTNFHVIKKWIESRKGIPAALTIEDKRVAAVAFGDVDCPGWEQVSWEDFFELMIEDELAFAFEDDRPETSARYFKFVPWEKYPDEIKTDIIAQKCFSC